MSARDKSLSPSSTVIGAAAAAALAIILRTAAAGAARSIHLLHMREREGTRERSEVKADSLQNMGKSYHLQMLLLLPSFAVF